jgi:hypothetical protein
MLGPNAAGPKKTPATHCFKNGEQTRDDERKTHPQSPVRRDDSCDQDNCADHTPHASAGWGQILVKETAHEEQ